MDILQPKTLLNDRYLIIQLVGRGGMGAVYKATDQNLKLTVAVKHTFQSSTKLNQAFKREARLLAQLRHASLPQVKDYFTTPEGQFLVMEFIPGPDLGAALARRQLPFSVDTVLDWADQLLQVLEYLHSRQPPVIHRDIKPQNLKQTDDATIILLDFGLAKGQAPLTATGSRISGGTSLHGYTPQYAPLEQINQSGTGPRSDLYAFSVTICHLLTGKLPPEARIRAAEVLNRQADPLQPPHLLNPAISSAVSNVLVQGAALAADDRPADAATMRHMLRAARTGAAIAEPNATAFESTPAESSETRPASDPNPTIPTPYDPGATLQENRPGAPLPQPVLVLPAITTELAPANASLAHVNSNTTIPIRTLPRWIWIVGLLLLLLIGGGGYLLATDLMNPNSAPPVSLVVSATATPSPTPTITPSRTPTPTPSATRTPSPTLTRTSTPAPTTPAATATRTPRPTARRTATARATATAQPNNVVAGLRMPDLVGQGEQQARQALMNLGINPRRILVIYQSRAELGDRFDQFGAYAVTETAPALGEPITNLTVVALYVRAPDAPTQETTGTAPSTTTAPTSTPPEDNRPPLPPTTVPPTPVPPPEPTPEPPTPEPPTPEPPTPEPPTPVPPPPYPYP